MDKPPPDPAPPAQASAAEREQAREARLAQALCQNLRRRKAPPPA